MSHSITQVFGDYVLVEASTDLDGGKMVLNYKKKETGQHIAFSDYYLYLSSEVRKNLVKIFRVRWLGYLYQSINSGLVFLRS